MKTLLVSLLLFAQVEDFSTRYHDAYVLEVIESKPADAAKKYLVLLEDKDAPKTIRLQAEFRFAVCCALLGRADEGRARLARLAVDPDLPATLRPQVEEYRRAMAKVGVGTALEAKLQELTMELAKLNIASHGHPEPYREFQVLGAPTVPYLKQLLNHDDYAIRTHAWRILLAMDLPDLVSLWEPSKVFPSYGMRNYLINHPKQLPLVESKLRKLEGSTLKQHLNNLTPIGAWSPEFGTWLVNSELAIETGMQLLSRGPKTRESEALVLHWLAKGSDKQQEAAARYYGEWVKEKGPLRRPPELFGKYVDVLRKTTVKPVSLSDYARLVPVSVRLDALERVIADAEKANNQRARKLLIAGLADALAYTIESDAEGEDDLKRFRTLFARWTARLDRGNMWRNMGSTSGIGHHLRWLVVRSSEEEATKIVVSLCSPGGNAHVLHTVLGFARADDAPLIRAALLHGREHFDWLTTWVIDSTRTAARSDPAYLRAVAPLWPVLVSTNDSKSAGRLRFFPNVAYQVPASIAKQVLLDTLRAAERYGVDVRMSGVIPALFPIVHEKGDPLSRYAYEIALPVLDEAWRLVPATKRQLLINFAIRLTWAAKIPDPARAQARKFVQKRWPQLSEWPERQHLAWREVSNHPERMAPELWIPLMSKTTWRGNRRAGYRPSFDTEFLTAAIRGFAARPELLNQNAIDFLSQYAPVDEVAELAASLYAKADEKQLAVLVGAGLACPVEMREKRLLEIVGEGRSPDPKLVLQLAQSIAKDKPTERLFPIVQRLLQVEDPTIRSAAIGLADSLGSEKLIPALLPLLDSLDPNIRERAKKTIDSILANRRIKEEVAERVR
ncbi:MAG: HEAT repeat domain-containing protein [Planctomycetota bacterium]|jgi:hypothetical protein